MRITILMLTLIVATSIRGLKAEIEAETEMEMLDSKDEEEEEEIFYPEGFSNLSADDESDGNTRVLKETDISILSDNCVEGECHDFIFDDLSEVVYFQAKPKVRFTSNSTYVLKQHKDFEVLRFIDSKFANFPLNLFYSMKIKELDMRNCSIQSITWDNFLMADQLSILLLSGNDLVEIKPMTFSTAENLMFLFLDGNDIDTLYNESFKELNKLYLLDLHDNRLETLPDVFTYLPALQQINLSGNRLRAIYDETFMNNPRLLNVDLQSNFLEAVGEYTFQNQEYMNYLDMSHNKPLKSLVGNLRADNIRVRNCSLARVNIYGKVKNVDLSKNQISELYFSQPESVEILHVADNSLEQIASLSKASNLQYFDLSNNPGLKVLPEYWDADSLQRLDLSNTSLSSIPKALMASFEQLKSLNISYNRLTNIDPSTFKYFERLNHLYIHHNNWNCYSLQILMDMLIMPWKISYTYDEYDDDFPGDYIGGIKCMYRLTDDDDDDDDVEDDMENSLNEPLTMSGLAAYLSEVVNAQDLTSSDQLSESSQQYDENMLSDNSDSTSDVEQLRREFKAVVGIYEQKFSILLKKVDDLDMRLKSLERYNNTMWKSVSITV